MEVFSLCLALSKLSLHEGSPLVAVLKRISGCLGEGGVFGLRSLPAPSYEGWVAIFCANMPASCSIPMIPFSKFCLADFKVRQG